MNDSTSSTQALDRLRETHQVMKEELHRVIVGQDEVIDQLLLGVLSRGHCLLVGVPGLAKTLLISSVSKTLDLSFNRIQFTPDLMPGDITGTELLHIDPETNERRFRFAKGPIFANVVLADEINRTPPKTQAALLESMMERQVTIGGERHPLDPIRSSCWPRRTPSSRKARTRCPRLSSIASCSWCRSPTRHSTRSARSCAGTTGEGEVALNQVVSAEELLTMQRAVRSIPVADHVFDYALALTRGTRVRSDQPLEFLEEWITWGAGPRASQFLILGAKAHAAIAGRNHVAVEDVKAVAHPVLRHRIVTNFSAAAEGMTPDKIIDRILQEVDPAAGVGAGVPGIQAAS